MFLFSGDLKTNVDFSDFIFVKIYSKFDVQKTKIVFLKIIRNKGNLTENHVKVNKYFLNISASSGAKIIRIGLEMTSQYLF